VAKKQLKYLDFDHTSKLLGFCTHRLAGRAKCGTRLHLWCSRPCQILPSSVYTFVPVWRKTSIFITLCISELRCHPFADLVRPNLACERDPWLCST